MHPIATFPTTVTDKSASWPEAARQVLNGLEHQFPPLQERRKIARHHYHVAASLHFGGAEGVEVPVYVRDVNQWAIGFLTSSRPASHAKATVTIETPTGALLKTRCLIRRCREVVPGWFDCVLEFDNAQPAFSQDALRQAA